MNTTRTPTTNKGAAYVLAIILLVSLTAMAASFAAFTNFNARTSKNVANIHSAQLVAESGMAFAVSHMRHLALPSTTTDSDVIANIAAALGSRLDGTPNLAGSTVAHSAQVVSVPAIGTHDGVFEVRVVQQADNTLTLQVHGWANGLQRIVAMDLHLRPGHPNSVFNYGLASRGPISISGNGEIRGKNELTEASVVSTTNAAVAVTVGGNAIVDGDISTVGQPTSVVITGTPTIAGSQDPAVIAQHIHFGVEPPVFPEVDTSIFLPLATNIIDQSTDTSVQGATFENVLIKAGTNPTFASDVTINGVVYIEAPNIVNFSGKVTLNAIIATEGTAEPIQSCQLSFQAQVEAYDVQALPDLPQFLPVKQLTGTFIVAPGFDVNFAGQFTTIHGTIAADKLAFSGQAEGTVKGSVIGLADYPTSVSGTVDIIIDQSGSDSTDAGFSVPMSLEIDPRSYRELTSQEGA